MSQGTILFVDDDPMILRSLKRELAGASFRCLFAESAAASLAIVEREPVHVMIADGCMPVMTGIELLTLLRGTHPHIVRVMLTGHGGAELAEQAVIDAGVFMMLSKPWEHDALHDALQSCLAQVSGLQETRGEEPRSLESRDRLLVAS